MPIALPDSYSDTPTPLPPPPRRVAFGATGGAGLWFMRLFILPHTAIGLVGLGVFLGRVAFLAVGADVDGHITAIEGYGNDRHGPLYIVRFTYDDCGKLASGSDTLGSGEYAKLQRAVAVEAGPADCVGMSVTIRHLALGPWHQAGLAEYAGLTAPFGLLLVGLVFWWAALLAALWQVWAVPLRTRWLARHGIAVTGAITGKHVQSGKSTTYYIEYSFDNPLTRQRVNRKMTTDAVGYERLRVGDAVTVLCHPVKPKRSTVYEASGYQVLDIALPPAFK